ncbi:hypothetical protein [Marinobacter salicampi]|uniref:hypothetical protein n=1 Tax=Marinobacter salicampi TaxID=435907 RepID=UPI00140CA7A8|nr:hypothetical protein [Marinobacter salicampi]
MHKDDSKDQLLHKLAKGIAYTGPVLAMVVGASALQANPDTHTTPATDTNIENEYLILATGEGEGEEEGEGESEGEGEAES